MKHRHCLHFIHPVCLQITKLLIVHPQALKAHQRALPPAWQVICVLPLLPETQTLPAPSSSLPSSCLQLQLRQPLLRKLHHHWPELVVTPAVTAEQVGQPEVPPQAGSQHSLQGTCLHSTAQYSTTHHSMHTDGWAHERGMCAASAAPHGLPHSPPHMSDPTAPPPTHPPVPAAPQGRQPHSRLTFQRNP